MEGHRHGIGLECLYLAAAIVKGSEVFVEVDKFDVVSQFFGDWCDFFTQYNVVKQWMEKPAGKRHKCASSNGLDPTALVDVQRLVDHTYRKVHLQRKLVGTADVNLSVDEVRRQLRRALLAGYFVNLAILHDVNHLEAGYSLLCGIASDESDKSMKTPQGPSLLPKFMMR
ncbi:Aste57867_11800 [Aphanomyces stellatus]|uniref:Aste57867_11800 protein n=1 Tax=Aphanomyces stellatus TaxID=120398 RepID=A0A485KUC7_9STRA|nr:hypothetical protein As57867_011755 [Aphanomyces stellatus]VFT88655.1 Aste57867_11800 [Aphanomyces stellatus]